MSGSFQAPGRACIARPITLSRLPSITCQSLLMSGDVRHMLPTSGAHASGWSTPHSQMDSAIGRPVAFSASLHVQNILSYSEWWPPLHVLEALQLHGNSNAHSLNQTASLKTKPRGTPPGETFTSTSTAMLRRVKDAPHAGVAATHIGMVLSKRGAIVVL